MELVAMVAWVGVLAVIGAVMVAAFRTGLVMARRIADGEAVSTGATVTVLAVTWAAAAVAGAALIGLAARSPLAG